MEKLEYTSNSIISESLIRRTDNTIANKGHKEKKTNNGQQMTNREKDKQWSTKDKNRKRQTMFNTKVDRKQLMIEQQQPTKIRGSSQVP
jgi:preprotein translocase subunit SecD